MNANDSCKKKKINKQTHSNARDESVKRMFLSYNVFAFKVRQVCNTVMILVGKKRNGRWYL